ncbi:MAG: FtsW/RodA/SpoVE family cell cycle protein, partial [Flavobacteriales bacterium]|nr:FtsW/RodA/SpoVE family cell cycle protein [Flavobacteriales bacterium]
IFILIRMILQTLRSVDMFSFLTLSGLLCMMMLQTIIHMSVVVGLIPVTGQNLPFISSGGTSVMMACLSVTIMQKIIARRMEITARQKAEAAAINSTDEVNDDEDIDNHMEESLYEDEDYAIDTLKKIQNQD